MSADPAAGAAPARFEPPVGVEAAAFWDATREGRLLVQWCTACDRGVFYPRAFCPHWRPGPTRSNGATASGRATVYAAVVENRPEAAGAEILGRRSRTVWHWSTWRRGCAC